MKTLYKIIGTLLILLVSLTICFVVGMSLMFGLWLQTYQAFTQEKLVAEIKVEKITPENGLDRMRVVYTPKNFDYALDLFVSGQSGEDDRSPKEFTMYGDQVLIGGPVVKFNNLPTLLGFETVYKVARIQGTFLDTAKANQIPSGNIHDLNGGIDDTWSYFEENSEKMSWLIDTAYYSSAGKSAQNEVRTFGLYITEDGFILDRIE